ncbi:uncharacterized protein METZ01_LOCUS211529 [marine metagenome]|uniref:Uncharacterized protein n=1 Tax=marine metagenome TaxID=408172 RepID=A0A382F7L1_9ZZZZ
MLANHPSNDGESGDGMKENNDQIGRVHVIGRRVWHFSDALMAF